MRKVVVNSLLGLIVAVFLLGYGDVEVCKASENDTMAVTYNSARVSEQEYDMFDDIEVMFREYDDMHPYPGKDAARAIQECVKNINIPDRTECIQQFNSFKEKVYEFKTNLLEGTPLFRHS